MNDTSSRKAIAQQPASRGVFTLLHMPPGDPLFVEGQSVHLTNDGSLCFVDAAFEQIMRFTPMKEELVKNCQIWHTRFEAFHRLITWFQTRDEELKPQVKDVSLVIALIASDIGCDLYKYI